jgi:hypothetical protein
MVATSSEKAVHILYGATLIPGRLKLYLDILK